MPLFRVEVLEDDADLEDVLEVFLDDLVVPAIRLNFEGEEIGIEQLFFIAVLWVGGCTFYFPFRNLVGYIAFIR